MPLAGLGQSKLSSIRLAQAIYPSPQHERKYLTNWSTHLLANVRETPEKMIGRWATAVQNRPSLPPINLPNPLPVYVHFRGRTLSIRSSVHGLGVQRVIPPDSTAALNWSSRCIHHSF